MPNREERTLKLIKGGRPGRTSRHVPRRTFTSYLPAATAPPPFEDVLRTLDEQPATLDGSAARTAAAEPSDVPEPPDVAPVRPRRLRIAALVVALTVALAAAGMFGHRWYGDRSLESAQQAALAAAKQTTVNFVSVSAASVDRDLQRITAGATGEFKDQFTQGQPKVREAVVENKVDSRGAVLRAALVSGDRRTAVVLLAVDATVKNVKAPDGRVAHYRIQVDMTRDAGSGAWLVSQLQFVG
jgi:Mce-associated membrane protein